MSEEEILAPSITKATFRALGRTRARGRSGPVVASHVTLAAHPTQLQVAYALPVRLGNAVVRNRIRRQMRAIIATHKDQITPGAYLVGVRPPALELDYDALTRHLLRALRQAARPRT